jgi:hypothetical protein
VYAGGRFLEYREKSLSRMVEIVRGLDDNESPSQEVERGRKKLRRIDKKDIFF